MRTAAALLAVVLCVAATACASTSPGASSPAAAAAVASPTEAAGAPGTAAGASPSARSPAGAPWLGAGALLVHWDRWDIASGGWSETLAPLDTATANDMPGTAPIELGAAPQRSISPDARLMAVTTRASGILTLYDLATGRPRATMQLMTADDRATPAFPSFGAGTDWYPDWTFAWTADSAHLFALRDYCSAPVGEGQCGSAWQRDLREIDVARRAARQVATFDFSPSELQVAPNGDRAYVLGLRTNTCCGIDPRGDPFVAAVDAASGAVTELALPGMPAGQPRSWLGDTSAYATYWPAIALAPDGSRLYVADSVEDRVTVVDAAALRVEHTIDLAPQTSGVSRFVGWLRSLAVATAEAKGGPYYARQAAVTPDGRYLVVAGMRALHAPAGAPEPWIERPAGLRIVDVATMQVVQRDTTSDAFTISPDGRWVLATGSYQDAARAAPDGTGGVVASGVAMYDLQSLRLAARRWPHALVSVAGVSPDSRYAYVTADGPGMHVGEPCTAECTLVGVVELHATAIVASRMLGPDSILSTLAPSR